MEIIRIEEGTYTRTATLKIDEETLGLFNSDFQQALAEDTVFTPLTLEELWAILKDSENAPRANEEYPVNLKFFHGIITLGAYVRCELNDFFAELPGELDERPEVWSDEFQS